MTVENFLGDLLHLNFSSALKRLEDWWTGMQPELKAIVIKFATDEGKIVWDAGKLVLEDLTSGKTFEQAVADGWQVIKDQAPSMALSDLADAAGIQKRAQPAIAPGA